MNWVFRLSTIGIVSMLGAFCAGIGVTWFWLSSNSAWERHLTQSFVAGLRIHESLQNNDAPPEGVELTYLNDQEQDLLNRGAFSLLRDLPSPALITNVSILSSGDDPTIGQTVSIILVSDSLRYSVSELVSSEQQSVAEKFGNVVRLLATYCDDSVMFVQLGDEAWLRLDGPTVWGCDAQPRDWRLLAALGAVIIIATIITAVADTSAHFKRFASALRERRRLGGPESYSTTGPLELREIVNAVNTYLAAERDQLSKRAMFLSGVSHDLGTPATRLRLRAALISDTELREKLEADIDSMTGMIESVLTYTRAELSAEEPRKISLTSLVEALVDDYRDIGKPVTMHQIKHPNFESGRSLFATQAGHGSVPEKPTVLVVARPVSLQRAISNLIDNALKYGRRASVELSATAHQAIITVQDEGDGINVSELEAAVAPFKRGSNTTSITGSGLGLTIVATVAEQHGGQLEFENFGRGVRAILKIRRT